MTLELELCQNKIGKPELFAKDLRDTRCNCLMKADLSNASVLKNVLLNGNVLHIFLLKENEVTGTVEPFMFKYLKETNKQAKQ